MTATTQCPQPCIFEMTVSDALLYSETQVDSLAVQLYENPQLQTVSFRILHKYGLLKPSKAAKRDSLYDCLSTVVQVEVPSIGPCAEGYYNYLAVAVLNRLSAELNELGSHNYH